MLPSETPDSGASSPVAPDHVKLRMDFLPADANDAFQIAALPAASPGRGLEIRLTGCASPAQMRADAYIVWRASRPALSSGAAAVFLAGFEVSDTGAGA